eukprot:Pgem_evm1s1889
MSIAVSGSQYYHNNNEKNNNILRTFNNNNSTDNKIEVKMIVNDSTDNISRIESSSSIIKTEAEYHDNYHQHPQYEQPPPPPTHQEPYYYQRPQSQHYSQDQFQQQQQQQQQQPQPQPQPQPQYSQQNHQQPPAQQPAHLVNTGSNMSLGGMGSQEFDQQEQGSREEMISRLMYDAIIRNDSVTLARILNSVPKVDPLEFDNIPPLILAAKLCHTEVLTLLLETNVDINCVDHRGWTALHWSSVMNNVDAVIHLCRAGVDLIARTSGNKTARELALIRNQPEMAEMLHQEEINREMNRGFIQNQLPYQQEHSHMPMIGNGFGSSGPVPSNKPLRACSDCQNTDTPQWRRGPDGSVSLCNACGLKYMKQKKKEERNSRSSESATPATDSPTESGSTPATESETA